MHSVFTYLFRKLKCFWRSRTNSENSVIFVFTYLRERFEYFSDFRTNSNKFGYIWYLFIYSVIVTFSDLVQINILDRTVTYFNVWCIMLCVPSDTTTTDFNSFSYVSKFCRGAEKLRCFGTQALQVIMKPLKRIGYVFKHATDRPVSDELRLQADQSATSWGLAYAA